MKIQASLEDGTEVVPLWKIRLQSILLYGESRNHFLCIEHTLAKMQIIIVIWGFSHLDIYW